MTLLAWGGAATAAYGMSLWGPTIIAQLMRIPVKQAAHFFVYISAAGILGKILFSFAAPMFGRRRLGQIHGFATFLALAAGRLFPFGAARRHIDLRRRLGGHRLLQCRRLLEPRPLYAGSLWRAHGGAGLRPRPGSQRRRKIIGPLSLAVIAGTSNMLKPAAIEAAVFPAFMFLACCGLTIGLAFTFLGRETHGKAVPQDAEANAPVAVPVPTTPGA